ncbi:MAG: glycosyltransferase, partial [Bacteroidetes bacterium]|nr:glycosyltransferase [Bacteroidota bacterium]
MPEPLISILLPFRDAGPWLRDCLYSIREQSLHNFEVLMVNDGSSDHSVLIALEFAAADPRFVPLENPGRGLVPANRFGLSRARGALVTRMDADDLMPPRKLEMLSSPLLEAGKGHVSTGHVRYFPREDLGMGTLHYEQWLNERCLHNDHWNWIWRECVIPSPCWMAFREDLLDLNAFEHDIYPDDYELMFRFFRAGFRVIPVNELCHLWRQHKQRMSRKHEGFKTEAFFQLKINLLHQRFDLPSKRLVLLGHGRKGKLLADMLPETQEFTWFSEREKAAGNLIKG